MSASPSDAGLAAVGGDKIIRRSWSRAEKRRIVEAAFRPGASVADVARHYGLNANQVFNWRRAAWATATGASPVPSPLHDTSPTAEAAGFVPLGVIVRAHDDVPPALPQPTPTQAADERPGRMEIELAGGTRLRVDAFVNERALRRVLSVLKALA